MLAPTLAPTPTPMIWQSAWVGYTLWVSFGRESRHESNSASTAFLCRSRFAGSVPGIRFALVRPVRFVPKSTPNSDTATCPGGRRLTPARWDDNWLGNHHGNTRHSEMVQRGEGLRLHPA